MNVIRFVTLELKLAVYTCHVVQLHLGESLTEAEGILKLLVITKMHCSCPADIYPFKANNRNTRTGCEICSKLTIKSLERRNRRHSGVFIVNFEHISHLILLFLLLTLNM